MQTGLEVSEQEEVHLWSEEAVVVVSSPLREAYTEIRLAPPSLLQEGAQSQEVGGGGGKFDLPTHKNYSCTISLVACHAYMVTAQVERLTLL